MPKRTIDYRSILIWVALTAFTAVPIVLATESPQLQWRGPIYILAGFAGILALALLLVQPLLIAGYLPGLSPMTARKIHRWIGGFLVATVALHVIGLWITSPPDVVDALLFVSPTPFSAWGVIAMWAVFVAAALAALRRVLRMRPKIWRISHTFLVAVTIIGTVVHAMLIEGTMETLSKAALCAVVFAAATKLIVNVLATLRARS
ncbi:MAG: ferric reductase-like transmembrane domain-containing protein [Hyphomicrobiales bacterium]